MPRQGLPQTPEWQFWALPALAGGASATRYQAGVGSLHTDSVSCREHRDTTASRLRSNQIDRATQKATDRLFAQIGAEENPAAHPGCAAARAADTIVWKGLPFGEKLWHQPAALSEAL